MSVLLRWMNVSKTVTTTMDPTDVPAMLAINSMMMDSTVMVHTFIFDKYIIIALLISLC